MHMEMGDALADAVVHGHERALRRHCVFDRSSEELNLSKERAHQVGRKVRESRYMTPRQHQAMTWKERPVVEEGERDLALVNDRSRHFAEDHPAEKTFFRHVHALLVRVLATGVVRFKD